MRLAIFDFDGTVLRGNSWQTFFWSSVARWPARAPLLLAALAARRVRLLSAATLRSIALRSLHGFPAGQVSALGATIYRERLRPGLRDAARREIDAARTRGMVPVVATAAFDFLVEPAAAELGIEHVIATRLAYANGFCLGRSLQPEPRGPAKVAALRAHFSASEVDWAASSAFSDELQDLPLLMSVGESTLIARRARPRKLDPKIRVLDWDR